MTNGLLSIIRDLLALHQNDSDYAFIPISLWEASNYAGMWLIRVL